MAEGSLEVTAPDDLAMRRSEIRAFYLLAMHEMPIEAIIEALQAQYTDLDEGDLERLLEDLRTVILSRPVGNA